MGRVRLGVLLLLLALLPSNQAFAQPPLIPMPLSVAWQKGGFPITTETVIEGQGDAAPTATYLSQALGLKRSKGSASRIRLMLVPDKIIAGQEAYRLTVSHNEVRIQASHPRGLHPRCPALPVAWPADRRQPPLLRQAGSPAHHR